MWDCDTEGQGRAPVLIQVVAGLVPREWCAEWAQREPLSWEATSTGALTSVLHPSDLHYSEYLSAK